MLAITRFFPHTRTRALLHFGRYRMMRDCWDSDPRNRPTFLQIAGVLAGFYTDTFNKPLPESHTQQQAAATSEAAADVTLSPRRPSFGAAFTSIFTRSRSKSSRNAGGKCQLQHSDESGIVRCEAHCGMGQGAGI